MSIYINDSIDLNTYKYVYKLTDNTISFTNKSYISLSSGETYNLDLYTQYLNQPLYTYNYSCLTGPLDESYLPVSAFDLSNNITDSYFFPQIFICGFILIFIIIFIINQLTKLVKKGGIFGFM